VTDEQDTTDDIAGKAEKVRMAALRAFGRAIWGAGAAYETELARAADEAGIKVRDVPRTGDFNEAMSLATFIGGCFASGEILEFDERKTLERLYDALRPPAKPKDEAVDLALELIERWAPEYQAAVGADSQARIARQLVNSLVAKVHPGLVALRWQSQAVEQLLARFSPGTGRKPKSGTESKLGATGILYELNKLADPSPANTGLYGPLAVTSPQGIASARTRHRETLTESGTCKP
jgi:hypothetical protein